MGIPSLRLMFKKTLSILLLCSALIASEDESDIRHIPYLMRSLRVEDSINLYLSHYAKEGQHNFEILQQMGTVLLEQGMRSDDAEMQLLSIFGTNMAHLSQSVDILEAGIFSKNPMIQIASIQYLGTIQDDRCDELLIKAMHSEFLQVRLEAAYQLAVRKHKVATGQVEALMYRLPRPMWAFFPQFFAVIGTKDAMIILRQMIEDPQLGVRIEAILSVANHQRDDLLKSVRSHLTHSNPAEQEASIHALAILRDSKSIPKIEKLTKSSSPNVQLAAANALYHFGNKENHKFILEQAEQEDLFAISKLGHIEEGKPLLAKLCKSSDQQVRLNSTLSLLSHHDPVCVPALCDFLLRDNRDLGFMPHHSIGRSSIAWKVIPSLQQQAKIAPYDLQAITIALREQMLRQSIELPEEHFFKIAQSLFDRRQNELIPMLVRLIENLNTPRAEELLKSIASKASDPLARTYCNLALFRMGKEGPYRDNIKAYLKEGGKKSLIQFRPLAPRELRVIDSQFELTAEENSRLLIEACMTMADKHDEECINTLLDLLLTSHAKNRFVFAGILLHAIE